MFCSNCGAKIEDNASFCPNCGNSTNAQDKGFVSNLDATVQKVESQLGDATADIAAHASNAFNNLERDLNGAVKEVADDIGIKTNNPTPQPGITPPPLNNATPNYNNSGAVPPYAGGATPPPYNNNFAYNNNGFGNNIPPVRRGGIMLKTDRSLLVYILLSIVTCGIYSYYFIYKLAQDLNIACDGDGETTSGLLMFIVLSIVTCGIYSWIWFYKVGNRLASNAPRYGMNFTENGTTVLLWMLFGSMLCGIGPFIAMNIIIKNTNSICAAYNNYNAANA